MAENGLPSDVERRSRKEHSVIGIPDDLEKLLSEPAFGPELCIYRVPRKLRAVNPEAYTPQMISIGPFHYQDKALKPMHTTKLGYLAGFCQRTNKKWTELADLIEENQERILSCYDEKFQKNRLLVEMILLDSVFILEFFLRRRHNAFESSHGREEAYKHDYILGKPTREQALLEDLILLENQLPYFVLEDVYTFATEESDFLDLVEGNLGGYLDYSHEVKDHGKCCYWSSDCFSCCYCFCKCCESNTSKEELVFSGPNEQPLHFTDLIRKARAYPRPLLQEGKTNQAVVSLNSAGKLEDAGVKLKVDSKAWPLNMRFEGEVLKMPKFHVEDGTERILRNLMAYEQCHYPNDPYICDYIWVLDFLINTEHDVDVLVQNGIVINLLGSNAAVAELVNKLCAEIFATGGCYYDTAKAVNDHCNNWWRKALAIMKSVYFSNLWRGTGTIAALILLVLTLVQSIYSIMKMFS